MIFLKIFLVVQVLGGLVLYPMVIAGKRADEKMTGIMHQEQEKTKKKNKLCVTVSQSWNMLKEGIVLGNRVKSRELMELGMRIRSRRIELKLSQEELAERAGINSNTVSRIEGGQMAMSVETFRKLVEVLCMGADTLLDTVGQSPQESHQIQNVCRRIWKLQEKEQEIVVKTMETLIDGLERR